MTLKLLIQNHVIDKTPINYWPSVEMIIASRNPIIQIHIKEIPPIEVLYNLKHKTILKKIKKKRKVAETQVLKTTTALPTTSLEVIWEGSFATHDDTFEELVQYERAYDFSGMKKTKKVKEFTKKKDEKIHKLENHSS